MVLVATKTNVILFFVCICKFEIRSKTTFLFGAEEKNEEMMFHQYEKRKHVMKKLKNKDVRTICF